MVVSLSLLGQVLAIAALGETGVEDAYQRTDVPRLHARQRKHGGLSRDRSSERPAAKGPMLREPPGLSHRSGVRKTSRIT
jgi:hypothetical protein